MRCVRVEGKEKESTYRDEEQCYRRIEPIRTSRLNGVVLKRERRKGKKKDDEVRQIRPCLHHANDECVSMQYTVQRRRGRERREGDAQSS